MTDWMLGNAYVPLDVVASGIAYGLVVYLVRWVLAMQRSMG